MMRAPHKGEPLSNRSGNAMPPYDKQNGPSRLTMPGLGTAAGKPINKTPLTPRVAGTAQPSAFTPLSRRVARHDANVTPTGSQREDFSTPVSSFLNNITPRSSSRKTRVDSTNTTPTYIPTDASTPDLFRAASDLSATGCPNSSDGLHIIGLDSSTPKRPTVTFSAALSEVGSQRDQSKTAVETKFFYASDAKCTAQQPRQQRHGPDSKVSSFLYANGDSMAPSHSSAGSAVGSVASSTLAEERGQPKFFRANGTPDLRTQPTHHSSVVGTGVRSPQFSPPRLASRGPGSVLSPLQRPRSPPKTGQNVALPQVKQASVLPSSAFPRPQPERDALTSKRSGSGTGTQRRASGHERSSSAGVLDLSPSARRISNATALAPHSPLFPISGIAFSITGDITATPKETLSEVGRDGDSSHSDNQSPIKAGHSLDRMNELAADARRERKVLDLEITNSSLAAINRTLEREMRKQNAELRRYRRLSRSGRLSIATAPSVRTSSGAFSDMDGLSDMPESETSDDSDGIDGEETSEEESVDEGSLSPRAMAENDARHRKKDEKRLQLDLSKHQQLLVDSQNMNQSLKRCLGWTEALINEGKKALAYSIRVSDIELGGRVLAPDEVEDADHEGISDFIDSTILPAASDDTGDEDRVGDENKKIGTVMAYDPSLDERPTSFQNQWS